MLYTNSDHGYDYDNTKTAPEVVPNLSKCNFNLFGVLVLFLSFVRIWPAGEYVPLYTRLLSNIVQLRPAGGGGVVLLVVADVNYVVHGDSGLCFN